MNSISTFSVTALDKSWKWKHLKTCRISKIFCFLKSRFSSFKNIPLCWYHSISISVKQAYLLTFSEYLYKHVYFKNALQRLSFVIIINKAIVILQIWLLSLCDLIGVKCECKLFLKSQGWWRRSTTTMKRCKLKLWGNIWAILVL